MTATLSGSLSGPGIFEAAISIQGSGAALFVPVLYLVGDGVPQNMIPLLGSSFEGVVGQNITDGALAFKLTDGLGVPIQGAPVLFGATLGGGSILSADSQTDLYGIATANVALGSSPGPAQFVALVPGLSLAFDGFARLQPAISANGVVNAASFSIGPGIAPGSYVSIFGTALSDSTEEVTTSYLPVSLGGVSVSFDVPSANISLPGRLFYVSPNQVNVQVPWGLQGQSSVMVKVSVGDISGALYTPAISAVSPAVYEYTEPSTNERLAAAVDLSSKLIGSNNAVRHGETIQVFANGLGPVNNQPADGDPAPETPLATTQMAPTVTIGGRPATVDYSGLAPGFPSLYQLNVVVPQDAPPGIQPLVITVNGIPSKQVSLPVQ